MLSHCRLDIPGSQMSLVKPRHGRHGCPAAHHTGCRTARGWKQTPRCCACRCAHLAADDARLQHLAKLAKEVEQVGVGPVGRQVAHKQRGVGPGVGVGWVSVREMPGGRERGGRVAGERQPQQNDSRSRTTAAPEGGQLVGSGPWGAGEGAHGSLPSSLLVPCPPGSLLLVAAVLHALPLGRPPVIPASSIAVVPSPSKLV